MAEDKPIIIRSDEMLDAIGGVSELIENYGDKYLIDSGRKGIVPEDRLMEFLRSIGKVGRANMGGMISIDELTKEPIKLKKGMTTNPVLNKLLKTKNFGALINEIGGASASVGMGQDLGGPGLEEAVQTQPGTRPSGSYDNITKKNPPPRDYIRGGNLQLKNVTKKVPGIENVNVGKGPPFLEKYTTKGGKDYINNVVKYVQGMGDDISAKAVSGGSFKGANPEFDKIRKSLIEEAKKNKGILRTYFTETKKPNEGVLINGKRYTMKKEPLDKLFKKVSGYVGKEDTKNFVKLVDQEIVKQGGKLSGKSGLVKDFILNEAQRLFKIGDKKGAKIILTALATSIPTISKAATPLTVPLTTIDIIKLSEKFGPDIVEKIQSGLETVTEPVTSKIAEAQSMFENMLKSKMNQGGMMDINFMTRPMGYKDGTRDGTLVGDKKEEIPVREIVRDEPEGIMGTLKSIFSKKEFGTIENPLPLSMVFEPGVSQKTLIDEGAFITTPDGITFKATPFMFDKYLGTKYVENNTFGQRDDVEVEFRPKYITSAEKSFVEPGGMFDQIQTPRKEGRFTEMNQGGIMDINQLTKRIR